MPKWDLRAPYQCCRIHVNCLWKIQEGKTIDVEKGDYSYVGSAMASKGSSCLARRLLRHGTRTKGQAQAIREAMLESSFIQAIAKFNQQFDCSIEGYVFVHRLKCPNRHHFHRLAVWRQCGIACEPLEF